MAFSSNNVEINQSQFNSEILYFPKNANVNIYKGSVVFLREGKASNGLAENDIYIGVCKETVIGGARPQISVDTKGVFAFKYSGDPVIGDAAYIDNTADNGTITTTAPETGLLVCVGVVVDISNGFAWVRIDNAITTPVVDVTPEPEPTENDNENDEQGE